MDTHRRRPVQAAAAAKSREGSTDGIYELRGTPELAGS